MPTDNKSSEFVDHNGPTETPARAAHPGTMPVLPETGEPEGPSTSETVGGLGDKVEAAKAVGADAVASLARTVSSVADSLEGKSPTAAKYVRNSADRAELFSQNLREWKVSEVGTTLKDFAKKQPVAVAGLGLVAGYIVARLAGTTDRRT